jgi:hypothetical protein
VRRADNLITLKPTAFKSGSLNLLETSGPVQTCNGIALPFTCMILGYPVAQLVEALRYKSKVAGSIPDGVIGNFH